MIISFFSTSILAQQKEFTPQDTVPKSLYELRYEKNYEKNIKKIRISGVYIPKDLEDAFNELMELSTKESLDKFKNADPHFAVPRLHFGLGRWMIVNWNFYDGSRFSHYLKQYQLTHPDDMAKFVLYTLHNKLNNKNLDEMAIANRILEERKIELENRKKVKEG